MELYNKGTSDIERELESLVCDYYESAAAMEGHPGSRPEEPHQVAKKERMALLQRELNYRKGL